MGVWMKRIAIAFILFFTFNVQADEADFKSGDIIFRTSSSNQSYAILVEL